MKNSIDNPMRRRVLEAGVGIAALGPHVPAAMAADASRARALAMSVQLVRNATVKLRIGERTLLIDPYLAAKNEGYSYAGTTRSPLVALPMPVNELLAEVDAVFVSHLHSDHFDQAAREVLPRSLPMLCPAPLAPRLRQFGFERVTGIGGGIDWLGVRLDITGGRHGPDAVLAEMGDVNGLIVRASGAPPLYWVGDSIWCAPVRQAIDDFAPDTIVVHACGAAWEGKSPLVMDAQHVEAVLRHNVMANVIATHMDCVDHATVSRADLVQHFTSMPSLAARLRIPTDGEVVRLSS
jgi:L-ascorbate metabolism protein UlaG (beta-lactamase superfamily)